MDALSVLLIAIGLAMDAFAVSVCKGLAMRTPNIRQMLIVGVWFGAFQAVMPILGFYLGESVHEYISQWDYLVAAGLLFLIGANMIREAFSKEEDEGGDDIGYKVPIQFAD